MKKIFCGHKLLFKWSLKTNMTAYFTWGDFSSLQPTAVSYQLWQNFPRQTGVFCILIDGTKLNAMAGCRKEETAGNFVCGDCVWGFVIFKFLRECHFGGNVYRRANKIQWNGLREVGKPHLWQNKEQKRKRIWCERKYRQFILVTKMIQEK